LWVGYLIEGSWGWGGEIRVARYTVVEGAVGERSQIVHNGSIIGKPDFQRFSKNRCLFKETFH